MAYDEELADRVRELLRRKKGYSEQNMFGGICFLIHGNMCCGVEKQRLMVRVAREDHGKISRIKGARPMDFTGRPMKGFFFVNKKHLARKASLAKWVGLCVDHAASLAPKGKKGSPKANRSKFKSTQEPR